MNDQSVLFDLPGPRALRREKIGNVVGTAVILAVAAWVIAGLAARGTTALLSRTFPKEMGLVGMHGSLTPAEMRVPLLVD